MAHTRKARVHRITVAICIVKCLGVKIFGGQVCIAGNIIVRQRGTKHNASVGVGMGKDHTLYALVDGKVVFKKKRDDRSYVSVVPVEG